VSNLLHQYGIQSRADLAKATPLGKSTIYAAFNADWSGMATGNVLAQLAGQFGVPMSILVVEPCTERNLRRSGKSRKGAAA
jgi:hypothetical protein